MTHDAGPVVRSLIERGETLAVAESLTGGLLAATIVDVPGASAAFRGGLVVYATELKATLAGVPAPLLTERGPVDPEVATALAAGARDRCGATWGLATTGVAGPEPQGGVAGPESQGGVAVTPLPAPAAGRPVPRPVGTVFVAVAGPAGTAVRSLALPGDRRAVREGAVHSALTLLASHLAAGG